MTRLFFHGAFETFDIANFFCIKIALDAPKTLYLETCTKFSHALSYAHSVHNNNQAAEGNSIIAPAVHKLSSSYTDPFGLAEFRQMSEFG